MQRIKSHYQEFVIDDYKFDEWYKELKNYDLEDVNQKLDQHLKSEEYYNQVPKLYFLTKYLTPINKKGIKKNIIVCCPICNREVNFENFDNHYGRCSSIRFINLQSIKYKGTGIDINMYQQMTDEKFEEKYDEICEFLLKQPDYLVDKKYIQNYLNSKTKNIKFNI